MLEELTTFRERASGGDGAFLQDLTTPVLLVEPYVASADLAVQTVSGRALEVAGEPRVARIQKRPGANVFSAMITVGRATNNDIVIDGKGVSKFHAFFALVGDAMTLVDSKSTYGTSVRGRRLEPQTERVTLASGDVLQFGSVKATYLTPGALFERVSARRR